MIIRLLVIATAFLAIAFEARADWIDAAKRKLWPHHYAAPPVAVEPPPVPEPAPPIEVTPPTPKAKPAAKRKRAKPEPKASRKKSRPRGA